MSQGSFGPLSKGGCPPPGWGQCQQRGQPHPRYSWREWAHGGSGFCHKGLIVVCTVSTLDRHSCHLVGSSLLRKPETAGGHCLPQPHYLGLGPGERGWGVVLTVTISDTHLLCTSHPRALLVWRSEALSEQWLPLDRTVVPLKGRRGCCLAV